MFDEEAESKLTELVDELYAGLVDDRDLIFFEGGIIRTAPTGAAPEYLTVEIEGIYDQSVMWRGVPASLQVGDEVTCWENPLSHRREIIGGSGATTTSTSSPWQKVTVAVAGGDFALLSAAITWINALPAPVAPAATRLFAVNILGGNFAEAADVTIPQFVHVGSEGEGTEIEMGAFSLIMSADTSLMDVIVESSDPVDAIRMNGVSNVILRNVRCIQGAAADCFHVLGASSGIELYNCIAETTTGNAIGFHVGGTATALLEYCQADDTTNFVDALLLDATACTTTTKWCAFHGAPGGDDVDTGAGSTWQHFCCNFDPANCTILGIETPLDGIRPQEITDYAQGYIFRGGAVDWEAYDASTAGAVLIGDGTDVISDVAPTIAGLVTGQAGFIATGYTLAGAPAAADYLVVGMDSPDGRISAYDPVAGAYLPLISDVDIYRLRYSSGDTNVLHYTLRLEVFTTGAAAAGLGTGIEFQIEDDGGGFDVLGTIECISTDVSAGAEHGAIIVRTADIGDDGLVERWRWDHDGAILVAGPSMTVPATWNLIGADNVADAMSIDDAGGLEYMRIVTTNAGPAQAVVFNNGEVDVDFRVAASGITNALFVQGSTGNVGITTAAPTRLLSLDAPTNVYMSYNIGGAEQWVTGYEGAANDRFIIYDTTANYRLIIDANGHVQPGGNKTQDLGLTGSRWREIFCSLALNTGTSRLVPVQKNCAVDGTQLVRSTGGLRVLGEESDFLLAFCPTCGTVAMEELRHRTNPIAKPAPKVVLVGMEVLKNSGNTKSVVVDFRYGDDVVAELGAIQRAPHNSTTLSDDELAAFLGMASDKERRAFLLNLGQIEWNALEKMEVIGPELDDEQAQIDFVIQDLVGTDLLKGVASGKPN